MKKLPLISICIPVLNEQSSIPALYKRLCALAEKMKSKCNLEFIFSDNHSSDSTWEILNDLYKKDQKVKALRFTKNIGFQKSILVNYMHAKGDAVFQIDSDMQDPPELLEDFFGYWEKGYKFIYGIRRKRPENIFLRIFRNTGYWIIDKLSDHSIPRGAGDFRLIDKDVVKKLLEIKTATPYLRGSIPSFGYKQIGIHFDRDKRISGETKFRLTHLLRLGIEGIFENSTIPLRLASCFGALILFFTFFGIIYYIFVRFFFPELPAGFSTLHIFMLSSIGLNAFLLGIIGEYILRIFMILKAEPIAILEKTINFKSSDLHL